MPGSDHEHYKAIAIFLIAAWSGLLSWFGKRQVKRIDEKVDRKEFDGMVKTLREANAETSRRVDEGHKRIYDKMEQDAREQRARDEKMLAAIYSKHSGKE